MRFLYLPHIEYRATGLLTSVYHASAARAQHRPAQYLTTTRGRCPGRQRPAAARPSSPFSRRKYRTVVADDDDAEASSSSPVPHAAGADGWLHAGHARGGGFRAFLARACSWIAGRLPEANLILSAKRRTCTFHHALSRVNRILFPIWSTAVGYSIYREAPPPPSLPP